MSTTFGDLTVVAQRHLLAVRRLDHSLISESDSIELLSAVARGVRSCQLLWRTVDRADRKFSDTDPAWQHAGQQLDRALTAASQLLRSLPTPPPRTGSTAATARLHAAAVAIGASHDLLTTHTSHPAAGPLDRTGLAAVIDSPDGRRAIASTAAAHLEQLTAVTDTVGRNSATSRAIREKALGASDILQAALRAIRTADILARPAPKHLPAVPLVQPLRLAPPLEGESPKTLLREAIRGAERLHRVALEELHTGQIARHTPGSLATVAVAMATTHHATAQIFRQLQPQVARVSPGPIGSELAAQLTDSLAAAEQAGDAWADVRTRWRGMRAAAEQGPADLIRREATDLTTRVGRLAHADPSWLPTLHADKRLRPGDELAPHPDALWDLLSGLRELSSVTAEIASDHVGLIRALQRQELILVRTRTLPAEHDVARPWSVAPTSTVQSLLFAQHHATATSRQSWTMTLSLSEQEQRRHGRGETIDLERRRMTSSPWTQRDNRGRSR